MKLVRDVEDFICAMAALVCMIFFLIISYPIELFMRIRDYAGALNRSPRYIRKEIARAGVAILSRRHLGHGVTCTDVIRELESLRCIPDLKGFDSIITLLRHRHRRKAFARLEKLSIEWGTGKIGFKEDKVELPLFPDNGEEIQA